MTRFGEIALVTPNWRWDDSPLPVDTLFPPVAPPLEWAYLASNAPAGLTRVVDAYAANLTPRNLAETIGQLRPRWAVVSTAPSILYWRCPPMTVRAVARAVSAIRELSDARVIVVGPHATHSPRWTLEATGADVAFRGAPERDLASYLALDVGSVGTTPFVADRSGRLSQIAVLRAEDLPTARFDAFDWSLPYEPHMWNVTADEIANLDLDRKSALVEASRGCPWGCSYCAKAPVRDRYGRRPLASLERELTDLESLGVGYVYFIDETFNLTGQHQEELLDLLTASQLSFGFQGRADLVTEESAARLASAGCVYAELGIDVASDDLALAIDRRQSGVRAEAGVLAAKEHIPITRFNRINLSTRDYAVRLGLSVGGEWEYPADPAYPYPGAPLGDMLMRLHDKDPFDWEFAELYSWWLRVEVHLQRNRPELPTTVVDELQRTFLATPRECAAVVAKLLEPIVLDESFLVANKYVEGVGNGVRIHSPGAE